MDGDLCSRQNAGDYHTPCVKYCWCNTTKWTDDLLTQRTKLLVSFQTNMITDSKINIIICEVRNSQLMCKSIHGIGVAFFAERNCPIYAERIYVSASKINKLICIFIDASIKLRKIHSGILLLRIILRLRQSS